MSSIAAPWIVSQIAINKKKLFIMTNSDFIMLLDRSQATISVVKKVLQVTNDYPSARTAAGWENMRLIVSKLRYIIMEAGNRRNADGCPNFNAAHPRG
jgi:hypothetical protein